MESISKYIEAKKKYYAELFEIAQLTPQERVIRDAHIDLYENMRSWLSNTEHTLEQTKKFYEAIIRLSKIPKEYYLSNHLIEIDLSVTEDELDIDDIIERCSAFPSAYADIMGMDTNYLPNYFFSQATNWGLNIPFQRLYFFVARKKKEFVDELKKQGITTENIEDFILLLKSGEDSSLVRDCISDISIEFGGNRKDLDFLSDYYENVHYIEKAIDADIEDTENNLKERLRECIHQTEQFVEESLLEIVVFKMGLDPLWGTLSEREKNAFNVLLNQPFIAPKIEDIINRTTIRSPKPDDDDEMFTLPDNYFRLSTSTDKSEFLTGGLFTQNSSVANFVELINYIADRGFIENNQATKQLLAFRLTGRMRPNGTLSKIKWTGKASHGADCIFLMKCTDSKNKFDRMRKFFEADFPDNPRSYASNASRSYIRKLNKLFPDIYTLPSTVKK